MKPLLASRLGESVKFTPLTYAQSCEPHTLPKSQTLAAKTGLRFERKVVRALVCGDFTKSLCGFLSAPNATLPLRCVTGGEINLLELTLVSNPWFKYQPYYYSKLQFCSPDILIFGKIKPNTLNTTLTTSSHTTTLIKQIPNTTLISSQYSNNFDFILLIEIKLTWLPLAWEKLNQIYLPVLKQIYTTLNIFPLVIVKNLTPNSPKSETKLGKALSLEFPLLHYLGSGPIF